MEVIRTVKVKLEVPTERCEDLHQPKAQFLHCANTTAEWAWRYPHDYCVTSKRKAEMYDIAVEQVSPAYTSQRCSSCGGTHENNRRSKHRFVCQTCEYELNADYNASKNVARKLLERLHSGQTSSSGGAPCQCALTSGTVNLNGEFHASVDSTAEGESTDKPTTPVVGY